MRLRGFEIITKYKDKGISLPTRKTTYSAGYDIAAAEEILVPVGKVILVPTGLKAFMQSDEYLGIHIRSSVAVKNMLSLINNHGIIDADYYNNPENEGHILIPIINHGKENVVLSKNARIAQGIFYKYLTIDQEKKCPQMRVGGFGSTD